MTIRKYSIIIRKKKWWLIMNFAEKISNLRKDNNMTQEDLAEKLNVSRQTISKWETNISIPDADNIVAISKLFNITTDELLDYKVETVQKKKQFLLDMTVLLFGIIGFIVFTILLMTNQIDETSSVITINGYGIAVILFLILIIAFIIIMIKRNGKK